MRRNILNIDEVELQPRPPQFAPTGQAAERYEARVYNITAVPPDKRAYPFHSHRAQEEMFYVIAGTTGTANS